MESTRRDISVTQSNRLIESAHTLTLNEKRLVLAAAAKLDPRKPSPSGGYLSVTGEEFADVFGVDTRNAYTLLEEAAERLFARKVRMIHTDRVEEFRWVFHVKYWHGKGRVDLGFSPNVLPYLTVINREFTTYQLRQVGSLPSFYSIRIYELLAQFKHSGQRTISLDRLREILELREKYADVKNFRVRVLEPALREINQRTDLKIIWALERAGRKVTGVRFTIEENQQQQLDLAAKAPAQLIPL